MVRNMTPSRYIYTDISSNPLPVSLERACWADSRSVILASFFLLSFLPHLLTWYLHCSICFVFCRVEIFTTNLSSKSQSVIGKCQEKPFYLPSWSRTFVTLNLSAEKVCLSKSNFIASHALIHNKRSKTIVNDMATIPTAEQSLL
jgi:hypothetical protein